MLLCAGLCALYVCATAFAAEPAESNADAPQDYIVVCPITGMVDEGLAVVVERAIRESSGARALVLRVDTFGGRVDSAVDIADALMKAPCPTIAYIEGKGAISAGALISYACKDIIMAKGTNIGAAQPVMLSAEGTLPTGEKEVSFMRAKMRALAEANGHNPDIAEAMVDADAALRAVTGPDGRVRVYRSNPGQGGSHTSVARTVERVVDALAPEGSTGEALRQAAREAVGAPAPSAVPAPPAQTATDGSWLVDDDTKLLTLTSVEAQRYGVTQAVVDSLDEALGYHQLAQVERREIVITAAERVFRFLTSPTIAGLLLMIGVGGLYIEMKTPGFGLAGVIGITALFLFFGARMVLGLASWLDLLLIIAGLALLAAEIFIIPGFGFAGVGGVLCILAGIYLALTRVTIPQYSWDYDRLYDAMQSFVVFVVSLGVLLAAIWRFLPRTPLYGRIVFEGVQLPESGYVVQTEEDERMALGLEGVAATVLRPSGRGRFGGRTIQVVTRGEYIEAGTPIVIIQAEGNQYVVKAFEPKEQDHA